MTSSMQSRPYVTDQNIYMPTQEFLQLVDSPRVQTQQDYILACKQYLARKLTKVKVFRSKDKPVLV